MMNEQRFNLLASLGTIAIISGWLDFFLGVGQMELIFYFFLIHISTTKDLSVNLIINAVNGYLLMGVLGAIFLNVTDVVQKLLDSHGMHAIRFAGNHEAQFQDYIYFSFVTLTTLGYGDIVPVSALARSATILIGISGQLYLTILVAMLVGKYLCNR